MKIAVLPGDGIGTEIVAEAVKVLKAELPWTLLGIHSTRIDVGTRDQAQDEALGLNGAWYADILMTLTQP